MELSEVEEHYRTLLRKRHDAAAEMSAPIDLPSSKEDLELYALQMREELLSTAWVSFWSTLILIRQTILAPIIPSGSIHPSIDTLIIRHLSTHSQLASIHSPNYTAMFFQIAPICRVF